MSFIYGWPNAQARAYCRACDSADLVEVLDLGAQPLANHFLREDQLDEPEQRYNLRMVRCRQCGLCQLDEVIDPKILYGAGYAYRSAYATGWRDHCEALADEIGQRLTLDIGCLDGTLLDCLFARGVGAIGCDPSAPPSAYHPIKRELFGRDTRFDIGQFDVIVAQNVFAHVDDARGFLEGIKANLKPDGVAIIECPWVVDLVKHRRWDTIYHEHLSYWGMVPLCRLAEEVGFQWVDAKHFAIHGGTVRYYLKPNGTHRQTTALLLYKAEEFGVLDYDRFRDSVHCEIQWWADWFRENNQKVIAGYGASAKSSTFLNALPERPPLVGIFDDNPLKQNLYTPGRHYPVLKPTKMTMRDCEILINFAPNWDLETKARELGFTGEIKSLWRR